MRRPPRMPFRADPTPRRGHTSSDRSQPLLEELFAANDGRTVVVDARVALPFGPAPPRVDPVRRALRKRTLRRRSAAALAGLLACSVLLCHAGARSDHLADLADFADLDRRTVTVVAVVDPVTMDVRTGSARTIRVRLLGVDGPPTGSAAALEAVRYLDARARGRSVTITFESPQSRSQDGSALASLFLTDTDHLNYDLIRDGHAFADRRISHPMGALLEMAESEARRKRRGVWAEPDVAMPAWRQAWVAQLRTARMEPAPPTQVIPATRPTKTRHTSKRRSPSS